MRNTIVTVNRTTIKTITTKKSILRVSLEAAIFAGCMFDAGDDACLLCGIPIAVGTEDGINGFGGICWGAGE